MNQLKLRRLLHSFFDEDVGECDITTTSIFPSNKIGKGTIIEKEDGTICGLEIIRVSYHLFDASIEVHTYQTDGEPVQKGDVIAEVSGPIVHLLTGERVILNLLQRMSGIATLTRKSVLALNDPITQICDTRKTMPGLRMLEKYAVTTGGGKNHRFGLYD